MKRKINREILLRLMALLFKEQVFAIVGILFLVGGVVANIAIPAVIREFLNTYGITTIANEYGFVCTIFIGLFAVQGICFYLRSFVFSFIGSRVARELRSAVFKKVIDAEVGFFDSMRTQDLVARLSSDITAIQDAVSVRISVVIRYALQVVAGVALMILISPSLTGVVVVTLLLLIGFSFILAKRLSYYSKALQERTSASASVADEAFTSIRVIKSFSIERRLEEIFSGINNTILGLSISRAKVSAFFQSFVSFLLNAALVLILAHGVVGVVDGDLASGDLVAFLAYGAMVAISFSFITGSLSELASASGAAERVFEILDRSDKTIGGEHILGELTLPDPATRAAAIELSGVCFAYPNRSEMRVIRELSLRVERGRKVAVIGESGSGKSTLVQLLLGFYSVTAGEISVFGHKISKGLAPVRKWIRYVPQEPALFALTLRENIRMGDLSASDAAIESVCRAVGLDQVISELPDGLDTYVGERGSQLSGGQKQRVAIARALIAKPEILILDEATSALDSLSEMRVLEAINSIVPKATIISVAHRLSTVADADELLVFDHGQLVEKGSHDELELKGGVYSSLVKRQQLSGNLPN